MKKIILLFLILITYNKSFSQTVEKNLKLIGFESIDSSFAQFGPGLIYTVPPGKIWKIENIICDYSVNVLINNKEITRGTALGSAPIYSYYNPNTSLWLKSGDKILFNYINANVFTHLIKFTYFEFVLE